MAANDPKYSGQFRVLDVALHELHKPFLASDPVPYAEALRVEEIPADQMHPDIENECIVKV
jgi:hypothetical protein